MARKGRPLCALVLDLDHFKDINDHWGHAGGDAVITEMGVRLRATLRGSDVVARLGGEEFAALLPGTGFSDAMDVAERIRVIIEGTAIEHQGRHIRVSASVGVAELTATDTSYEELLRRADAAMYEAKAAGRNRVSPARVAGSSVARAA